MAPPERVVKAFRAMRKLQIPDEKTKPVLIHLLKIFEKNWAVIEAENYRVLIDAIFDSEDTEASEVKNTVNNAEQMNIEEKTHIREEPESSLKRLWSRHQEDQASPSSITPSTTSTGTLSKKPKIDVEEQLSKSQPELQSPVKTTVTEPVSLPKPSTNGDALTDNNSAKELAITNHVQPASIGSTRELDIARSSTGFESTWIDPD